MQKAPKENRAVSQINPEQSKEILAKLLSAKMKRIDGVVETNTDERSRKQYEVARSSVDQRQKLLERIMA